MRLQTALELVADLKTGPYGVTKTVGNPKAGWRFWFDDGGISSLLRYSKGDYQYVKEFNGKQPPASGE